MEIIAISSGISLFLFCFFISLLNFFSRRKGKRKIPFLKEEEEKDKKKKILRRKEEENGKEKNFFRKSGRRR